MVPYWLFLHWLNNAAIKSSSCCHKKGIQNYSQLSSNQSSTINVTNPSYLQLCKRRHQGLGKAGAKHHREVVVVKSTVPLCPPPLLTNCGSIKNVSGFMNKETFEVLQVFLKNVI